MFFSCLQYSTMISTFQGVNLLKKHEASKNIAVKTVQYIQVYSGGHIEKEDVRSLTHILTFYI